MNSIEKAVVEPPLLQNHVLIGRDSYGHWVVKDEQGLHGGIFTDRVQALKYAMRDLGQKLQAVIMVPGILEFDLRAARPVRARTHDEHITVRRMA